ncbi:MAG: PAS domain-containing protein [Chitinophagaceae bacterium]|nr:MAG: PAS domain-containing protein [Chitinophagaceae bacterium]
MYPSVLNAVLLKAMDSAREGITIADATRPGLPLIYINEGFERMTGYTRAECIGRSCNFLQGAATDQAQLAILRAGLREAKPVQVELLNHHKSGQVFHNRLSITPIFDEQGSLTHFIGVQDDITVQKEREVLARAIGEHRLREEVTVEAQEKERLHIGRELHDNVNQLLASASLRLNLAAAREDIRMELLEQTRDIVQTSIREIRKLSHLLAGPQNPEWKLRESLQDLISSMVPAGSLQLSCHFEPVTDERLSGQKKLALYRVAQERLNNILKHAGARQVWIGLECDAGEMLLRIKDDGVGFDVAGKYRGIGLKNMKARLEMISGRMHLRSAPGKGCELEAIVPLECVPV